jgi:RNA polymerase sigma-70 factor (ECF subfamily)
MDDQSEPQFLEFLNDHRKIVLKVASMYCRDPEERRDLAQEIVLQLWRAYPGYDRERPFSTWMYRIALNVAISSARRAARRNLEVPLEETTGDVIDLAGRAAPDDRIEALYQYMATLAPLDRALVMLYLDERSYREIADILGISETNVSTKINRLKQRMRRDVAARR